MRVYMDNNHKFRRWRRVESHRSCESVYVNLARSPSLMVRKGEENIEKEREKKRREELQRSSVHRSSMEIHDDMLTPASHDVSLCRVCLSMDHDNQCIFRKDWNNPNDTFMLSEKLQLCSGVEVRLLFAFFFLSCVIRISLLMWNTLYFQILENDGLPANICTRCMIKVNVAYELRQQCQRSDMELRRLYGKTLKKYVVSNNVLIKVFLFM